MSDRSAPLTLGFLTVVNEANGYLGGYLVTNGWGRPLEFRLTTAVQPNKVQEILYGATLHEYILADLIGKTLIEKTSVQPTMVVTDLLPMLALRSRIDVPVVAVAQDKKPHADTLSLPHSRAKHPLLYSVRFPDDAARITALLDEVDQAVELSEPFVRVREAIAEARKLGVDRRAA